MVLSYIWKEWETKTGGLESPKIKKQSIFDSSQKISSWRLTMGSVKSERTGKTQKKQQRAPKRARSPQGAKRKPSKSPDIKIVLIGAGGIGSHLALFISRYLRSEKFASHEMKISIIDKDKIENKNLERQSFTHQEGFKSVYLKDQCILAHWGSDNILKVVSINKYVTEENIDSFDLEDSYIFLCVDNHWARKIINRKVLTLKNAVLISAGNELIDGNVSTYMRVNGETVGSDLEYLDPSITDSVTPEEERANCGGVFVTQPQIIWTNLQAAVMAGQVFANLMDGLLPPDVIYFDAQNFAQRTEKRVYSDAKTERAHRKKIKVKNAK